MCRTILDTSDQDFSYGMHVSDWTKNMIIKVLTLPVTNQVITLAMTQAQNPETLNRQQQYYGRSVGQQNSCSCP